MKSRVFIVDDHVSILKTLECALPLLLPCEIVGTSRTATDALKAIPRAKPDVLWVDVCLPGLDGPSLLRLLRARDFTAPAVLCTGAAGGAQIREAMSAEPACFVSKSDEMSCWRKALEAAAQGGTYFSPKIAEARKSKPDAGLASLTDMERVVFSLVVKNLTKDHIAETLGLSPHTVRHHREHVMKKLKVHAVEELCAIAARTGLLGSE